MKLVDYRCGACGFMREEVVLDGAGHFVNFMHCGVPSAKMPGAPMIKFVEPHFNRPLGQFVTDAGDLERKQKKAGIFTPNKADLESAMNTDPIKELRPRADKEKIRAKAEKVWSDLHNEHKVEDLPSV